METKYRIKEYTHYDGRKSYVTEKKSIFGFWYNFDNIDGSITGWHSTLEDAQDRINQKKYKKKSRIVQFQTNRYNSKQ